MDDYICVRRADFENRIKASVLDYIASNEELEFSFIKGCIKAVDVMCEQLDKREE